MIWPLIFTHQEGERLSRGSAGFGCDNLSLLSFWSYHELWILVDGSGLCGDGALRSWNSGSALAGLIHVVFEPPAVHRALTVRST